MKQIFLALLGGSMSLMVGCTSISRTAQMAPVGPTGSANLGAANEGALQVYSARSPRPIDPNLETHLWNNDFGRNDFLYEPTHTDYTIYSPEGQVIRRVQNTTQGNQAQPAMVTLPAGSYRVAADATAFAGAEKTVEVPVIIQAGQLTTVNLERNLTAGSSAESSSARLAGN